MSAKKKQAMEITLGGGLKLSIDGNGAVRQEDLVELTATDLDRMAAASALSVAAHKAWGKVPENTRADGYEITFSDDGGVTIGCQNISADDIAMVHRLSLKQRGK